MCCAKQTNLEQQIRCEGSMGTVVLFPLSADKTEKIWCDSAGKQSYKDLLRISAISQRRANLTKLLVTPLLKYALVGSFQIMVV